MTDLPMRRRVGDDPDLQRQMAATREASALLWEAHVKEHEMLDAHRRDRAAIYTADRTERDQAEERQLLLHVQAHEREHQMTATAIEKAERAMEIRLEGMNEFRSQLREQATGFVPRESFDTFVSSHTDRASVLEKALTERANTLERVTSERANALEKATSERVAATEKTILDRIIAIEKSDVKGEGKSQGQGVVIAAIVASVGFAATLIALLVVIADLLAK